MTKKISTIIIILQMAVGFASGQPFMGAFDGSLLPKLNINAQSEFVVQETVVNPQAWENQAGLHAAFGSSDRLYFRKEVPEVDKIAVSFRQTAWRGERINMQVLVWSSDSLLQVRFETEGLKSASGRMIPSSCILLNLVRYVISNFPYGDRKMTCIPVWDTGTELPYPDGYLLPDRFEPFDRFDLPEKSVRPVWIMLNVPQDTEAGIYTGAITVKTTKETATLRLSIKVQNPVLPKPSEWKHHLDLWQNPWIMAWYHHVEPWSEEHKTLLRQHLKLYVDAGGTFITTYAIHAPWTNTSHRVEAGMIEWIKQKDDHWRFDYTVFDDYVQLAMDCGIDKAITIYTPVSKWVKSFRYLDEKTGNYEYYTLEPETSDYKNIWNIFLTDLKNHLMQKGWFNIAYIGFNETRLDQTIAAMKVVKAHSPLWKITFAGTWHPELDELVDDYSTHFTKQPSMEQVKARRDMGKTTTFYVACDPPVPNNFLCSPPIEARWMGWHRAAYGYDGFLRWAFDSWPDDPNRDGRHYKRGAGNSFLVYPGGHSCIRYEKLREGIVEQEKIRILRDKVAQSNDKQVKQLWQDFEKQLVVFIKETGFDTEKITQDVYQGKALMDAISDLLVN